MLRASHPLPGVRFEAKPPPVQETLPRMDVAVFVGFAASGPICHPVVVEDVAQFAGIFGDDAPLAWDQAHGRQLYAYLAPAVRAFFRNGGQRCWIVRVADVDEARTNHFGVNALLQARFDPQGNLMNQQPAFCQARSAGSWSDDVLVGTALAPQPLDITPLSLADLEFSVAAGPSVPVVGELLRLTFPNEGQMLMFVVDTVSSAGAASPSLGSRLLVRGRNPIWFQPLWRKVPSSPYGSTRLFPYGEAPQDYLTAVPLNANGSPQQSALDWPASAQALAALDLSLAYADAPVIGELVQVTFGTDQLWLVVQDTQRTELGSPAPDAVRILGDGLWLSAKPPASPPLSVPQGELLRFELWTKEGAATIQRLTDLGFDPAHPRFWGSLPSDDQLFPDPAPNPRVPPLSALWQQVTEPRFPLAGEGDVLAIYFPIAMGLLPGRFLGPEPSVEPELQRDGLQNFNSGLFLDPGLQDTGAEDLLAAADYIRYQGPTTRRLKGIHLALDIDEASIVSVPDAVHRGWKSSSLPPLQPPAKSLPMPRPAGQFLDCSLRVPNPPTLHSSTELSETGTFVLSWEADELGAEFVLQETTQLDTSLRMTGGTTIYTGRDSSLTLYGRRQGDYYYRLRLVALDGNTSDWSNEIGVRVEGSFAYAVLPEDVYEADVVLRPVQRALLQMSAARGDLFAALALPSHYREQESAAHAASLVTSGWVGLGSEPDRTRSFGALYHPWLIGREENQPAELRQTPPDGAACGTIAQRARTRGAWVAPANKGFSGVVALTPPIQPERWQDLQNAQINLIRQEPRGFVALNEDTLSNDDDLRPINVRRLLSLLRRLALREGVKYVFEPNDDSFRRLVQRGFEGILSSLFARGAFAGTQPAEGFQVVTDSTLNPAASVDQGRFIVELRVAPALPMTFLTVRLVQVGDRGLVTQEF